MRYEKPITIILEVAADLLSMSGPDAGDIGSPNVNYNVKEGSIWDEVKQLSYNEENYEDKVYE